MIRRSLLALVLALACVAAPAHAQNPNDFGATTEEAPAPSGPDPVYGYVVCSILAAVAIFAVCKSARR
jgi:uncharacterized protein HemY